ncbi:MAG: phosphoglycerate mutase family protein [Acidimicrobiia bacterium]|nr:phosphoglycerate mutase family protein [Acidimicrobiia bacterium]
MAVHLVRHAHAGKRSDWIGDDSERPLSDRGRTQADALVADLAGVAVGRIVSSPYVRCIQSVEPLAASRGLAVEPNEAFAEGMDGDAAHAMLRELDAVDGVACSHGDVLPALLRRLVVSGMETDGPLVVQKGSMWIVEFADGRPSRGRYVPPIDRR